MNREEEPTKVPEKDKPEGEDLWQRYGACDVDGVNIAHFSKYSQRRLLAVNEYLREGTYQPSAIKRVYIPNDGSNEKRRFS